MSLFEPERIVEMVKADTSLPVVNLCGFCQRVAWSAAEPRPQWVAPETYYRQGGAADVRVSHGVCPECLDRL